MSGQLVSLSEVADVLREHPFVREAEVVNVDRDDAPAIVACVVLERDARGRGETGEELIAHGKDTIGGLARPGIVVFVESFPPELDIESRRLALRRLALDPRVATRSTISTGDLLAAARPADYR